MKSVFSLIIILAFAFLSAQKKSIKIEKIKIGNFEYEINLKEAWFYEENKSYINYTLRLKNEQQFLGNYLTYRKTGSSKNYEKKVSAELPPDPRSVLKDGVILSEGEIEINKNRREIIVIEKILYKDKDFEDSPDSIKRIYRQRKNGIFELLKISEYYGSIEKVMFEK